MNTKSQSKQELDTILDNVAESILEISDAAIIEMVNESGQTPEELTAHFRNVLREADKEYRQRYLNAAKKKHAVESKKLETYGCDLPRTLEERRSLLQSVLLLLPESQMGLTFQNRNFESLSDEDIEETLKQLKILGLLDELQKNSGEKE